MAETNGHAPAGARYDGPAVVHLGHIKTASTFLQQRVFGRPGTGTGVPGGAASRGHLIEELVIRDPFDDDAAAAAGRFAALEEPVRAAGLVPVWSDEVLIGDPCQRAYHGRAVAERLIAMGRPIRVLIVVREQRSFAWSAYRQYLQCGGILPLEDFVGRPGLGRGHSPILRPDYLAFDGAVGFWQRAIGPGAVTVLPYEMLRGDPAGFMAGLAALIGRARLEAATGEVVNPAEPAATLWLRRLGNRLAPVSPLDPRPGWGRRSFARAARLGGRALPPALNRGVEARARQRIEALYGTRFAASNARLAAMTGLDLERWGYPVAAGTTDVPAAQPRTRTGSAPMVEGSSTARTR